MEKNQDHLDLNQQGTEKIQHPSDSITNGTDETPYLPYRKPYPSDETPDQKINLLYKSIKSDTRCLWILYYCLNQDFWILCLSFLIF